ncbi:hypothetical protein HNR13_000280 [Leifsonia shinshuensis]|uniref:Uncharacterized protein n=1 Tax=Leifsonia shinshuensis TaxID=150026 RepID=A0A853CPZ1_9MICO|nr:hypothetical protein [Leifsonia shinshuensis]
MILWNTLGTIGIALTVAVIVLAVIWLRRLSRK